LNHQIWGWKRKENQRTKINYSYNGIFNNIYGDYWCISRTYYTIYGICYTSN